MSKLGKLALGVAALLILSAVVVIAVSERAEFFAGGALINLGYRLQDRLEPFDFVHHESLSPDHVWDEVRSQNDVAASVRERFPRSEHHPLVVILMCMDARIDSNELVGDTRRYYYIVRTAGSVLSVKEEEMLELGVEHGVKLIILATHTDCAAEKAAANPEWRRKLPELAAAVDERGRREEELLARPAIARRIADGTLLVKRVTIDTATARIGERR